MIFLPTQFLPSFLPKAFSGVSTPADAGRHLLFVNFGAAFRAFGLDFIGEYLYFVPAIRAFVY